MKKSIVSMAVVLVLGTSASLQAQVSTAQRVVIEGSKGKLVALIQKPDLKKGEKCPVAILAHGFGGRKEGPMFERVADSLQVHGIASIRFDFNGHGESEGRFQDMTVPNEVEDIKCVYRYVTQLPYCNGVVGMAGHSQGGVVVSMAAGDLGNKISAVVLMAPAAVLREDAIRGNTMGAMYNPLDPPEAIKLFGDLYLGGEYVRTAFDLPIYETAAKYHGPASIIHGTGDRVVPYTYGVRYHDIWPGSELHILPGDDHGFSRNSVQSSAMASDYLIRFMKTE